MKERICDRISEELSDFAEITPLLCFGTVNDVNRDICCLLISIPGIHLFWSE